MSQTTMQTAIDPAAIGTLRAGLRGPVIAPDDDDYDAARRTWNATADRRPALVARCTGTADAIRALAFAREHDLLVAVRGGGHSMPGYSTCDGGIVIDLSPMKGVLVDVGRRSVRAQAGVTWGEFDRETQQFGLAVTGGGVSTTGIAGLTLGGGFGWLGRRYGLSSDNLLSADVVTADGRFVRASETEEPDLFWGLRGGGGNFGIVTSFEYQLHDVGPVIMGGMVAYASDDAAAVLRYFRDLTASAPDDLAVDAMLGSAPDGTPIVALFAAYAGSVESGERALRGANKVATPLVDDLNPRPYVRQQSDLWDAAFPSGQSYYWSSHFMDDLTDDVIDLLVRGFPATRPYPRHDVLIEHLGGAIAARDDDATAFGHRAARYNILVGTNWIDPSDTGRAVGWVKEVSAQVAPHSRGGGYVNYVADEGEASVRGAYGGRYDRLVALKDRYDPENVFGLNQNITPSARR